MAASILFQPPEAEAELRPVGEAAVEVLVVETLCRHILDRDRASWIGIGLFFKDSEIFIFF